MLYLILSVVLIVLVYLPTVWVRWVMHRYAANIEGMPGTGGELAQHLVERFDLEPVSVEKTDKGDHYDPVAKMVRLSSSNFDGQSLTAVAIAAHEVGHAIQFNRKETVSKLRMKYIPLAMLLKKSGIMLLAMLPIIGLLTKAVSAMFALIALSLGLQLLGALAYLIVLPEEWDASFNKAMPILIKGEYIRQQDIPAVQSILRAAAFTYFAGALADMVNIGRWLLVLRR